MTDVLPLNLVFFIPGTCGAAAFAFIVHRVLSSPAAACAVSTRRREQGAAAGRGAG